MNKIGILTYHRADGYGAVLQAYALCKFIGHISNTKPIIIDYQCEAIDDVHKLFQINKNKNIFIEMCKLIPKLSQIPGKRKSTKTFTEFRKKYLPISEETYTKESIRSISDNFDHFIVGSDQTWNFELSGLDKTYFLDFVLDSKKKNSYAASFGFEKNFEQFKDEFLILLSDFNHLSLRETIGARELQEMGKSFVISVDPTLLLDSQKWRQIAKKPKLKEKFILIYTVLPPKNLFDFARELAKKTGLKIFYLTASVRIYNGIKKISGFSPEEFLGLFANAEYIFTTSFHGTAFSILFHKRFFVELDNGKRHNDRVDNLLSTLNLHDRNLSGKALADYDHAVDWDSVDAKLEIEKQKSFKYLKSILSE